jgi:hypothetical protein
MTPWWRRRALSRRSDVVVPVHPSLSRKPCTAAALRCRVALNTSGVDAAAASGCSSRKKAASGTAIDRQGHRKRLSPGSRRTADPSCTSAVCSRLPAKCSALRAAGKRWPERNRLSRPLFTQERRRDGTTWGKCWGDFSKGQGDLCSLRLKFYFLVMIQNFCTSLPI